MGASLVCRRRRKLRVLLVGLDAAGKTSLLYRFKTGELLTTIPTIGFNVEVVELPEASVTVWDIGGRDKIRPLYRHYWPGTQRLVLVVDSADAERLPYAFNELTFALESDELAGVPVAVVFNKSDLPQAAGFDSLRDAFGQCLPQASLGNRRVTLFSVSAASGAGVQDVCDWIVCPEQSAGAAVQEEQQQTVEAGHGFWGSVSVAAKSVTRTLLFR